MDEMILWRNRGEQATSTTERMHHNNLCQEAFVLGNTRILRLNYQWMFLNEVVLV